MVGDDGRFQEFIECVLSAEIEIVHSEFGLRGQADVLEVGGGGLEFLGDGTRWQTVEERRIGADRLTIHRRMGRFAIKA